MAEIDPEVGPILNQYVAQLKAASVESVGRGQVDESNRLLEQHNQLMTIVDLPARELTDVFFTGAWSYMPEGAKEERREKIKTWVDRAEAGDIVAQAVLLRARTILDGQKIPTAGFPSFEWKDPSKAGK